MSNSTTLAVVGGTLVVWALWPSLVTLIRYWSPFPVLTDPAPGSKRQRTTSGLVNRANDCFCNATLQALAGLKRFRDTLDQTQGPAAESLRTLLYQLVEPIASPRTLSAWPFLRILEQIHHAYFSPHQQDAHELLQILLETVDAEGPDALSDVKGYTEDTIECLRCHHTTRTQTPFLVHTVPVPHQNSADIAELLIPSTELVNDYFCEHCGQKAIIRKTTSIIPAPILCIHLNRSMYSVGSGGSRRNSCSITVPEYLSLAGVEYHLKSAVFHAGTHWSGHYDAMRRRHASGWWKISDHKVSSVSHIEGGSKVYLVFYEALGPQSESSTLTSMIASLTENKDKIQYETK